MPSPSVARRTRFASFALSLVFWALILTVSVKYVILILRADNRGEGGVLSLATLVAHGLAGKSERIRAMVMIPAIIGLALFYGDGLITPAISVLSAVEGLNSVEPALQPWIVPLAVLVLGGLFLLQARGTGRVGKLFGPVMLLWFAVLAMLGIAQIVQNPGVLAALNPPIQFSENAVAAADVSDIVHFDDVHTLRIYPPGQTASNGHASGRSYVGRHTDVA